MLNITLTGTEEIRGQFSSMGSNVRNALRLAIQASVIDMEAQVKEKLSGPVLRNRTGRLRNSVTSDVSESASTITGIVGANTPYAALHEYGFQGVVTVREHLRLITQAFGNPLKAPVEATIRAHTMNMDAPERSYLRSTLRENGPRIVERLQHAVRQVALNEAYSAP